MHALMPAPVKTKSKRSWWRRLLRAALWLFVGLLVLHWPLVIFGVPLAARMAAKSQHVDVSFDLGGTIWTNLAISNLRVTPSGTGPTSVERMTIGKVQLDFSLWKLARAGVGEFISNYEVHHADLALAPLPGKTKEEKEAKQSLREQLRAILGQPAAYSDRVELEDINVRLTSAGVLTEVRGLDLLLDPQKAGHFRIARVAVPGLPLWENMNAETSYTNRNLIKRGLQLGPQITIDELNFDASHRAEHRGQIALKMRVFGGDFSLLLTGAESGAVGEHLAKSYDTHLTLGIHGVKVREAAEYFGVKGVPVERLGTLEIDFTGDPEKPRTWTGSVKTRIEQIVVGAMTIPEVEFASDFSGGNATSKATVQIGGNRVLLDTRVALPEAMDGWMDVNADSNAQISASDFAAFVPDAKTAGTAAITAKLGYRDRTANVRIELQAKNVVFNDVTTTTVDGQIDAKLPLADTKTSPLKNLDATALIDAGAVRVGTFTIDGAKLAATFSRGLVNVKQLSVKRGSNTIGATARVQLPDDPKDTSKLGGEADFTIAAQQLTEFGIAIGTHTLGGELNADGRVRFAGLGVSGLVQLRGGVALGDFRTHELGARVQLRGNTVELENFTLALNDADRITLKGRFDTAEPQLYEGALTLGIRDLAVLQPLLAVFDVKEKLTGALDMSWSGKGALKAGQNEGDASITLKGAKYGATEVNEFLLGGSYTSDSAKVELRAKSGPTQLGTQIVWANERVTLRDLEVRQGDQRALTGEISYGLAGLGGAGFDPMKQAVSASLHADKLDIEKLLDGFVKPAPASGRLTLHLAAQGTPLRPEVELKIEGRALKAKAAAQFDPAELDLALNYKPGAFALDAAVRQPLIQPLTVKARVPLDVEKIVADKKLDPALPLDLSVKLPPTSLAVVPKLSSAVRRIDGTVALDVHAEGTIEKPQLSGAATVALKEARLTNASVPAIGKFDARLVFAKDTLTFERFAGEVGGGTFGLGGTVGLADLKDPKFNLQLKADDVLGMRNDAITVRADADIKVGGALKAGTVSGSVFVTQSRFFKEIDILPIGLPGKPKPAPKSAPSTPEITLPPPLDAWKIDLAIKTREDDPFRVMGNMANGRVALNLLVGNTGKQPWLEGDVTVEQFTGSLPFSTITVENGHVYFTKNAPFQPTLDLQAQSKVRDYTVGAYIFGKATEPQLQLTSEPPLPHADIISLLATGTTVGELSGSADVLASRAAMLAVTSLWKKIFKPKAGAAAPPPPKKGDANFADRFQLELGSVDQKTGAREATAKFKVSDQTYILGELDTQGRYTGSLKYLLRFR